MTVPIVPFELTMAELMLTLDNPGPHVFRRRHVIDTGEGLVIQDQIQTSRTISSHRRDPQTGAWVQVI